MGFGQSKHCVHSDCKNYDEYVTIVCDECEFKHRDRRQSWIDFTPNTTEINKNMLVMTRNQWMRYEDPATHIVFNPVTQAAYGVQESNGKCIPLTEDHIKICVERGWKYDV